MRQRKKRNPFDNLVSFDAMPPERHRELSARGGRASGEARRKNKSTGDYIDKFMQSYFAVDDELDKIKAEYKQFRKWIDGKEKYCSEWNEFQKWRRREARAKRE